MNLSVIKERYMKEPFSRRIGHLASDLARISSFLDNSKNTKAVSDILEESKFFIEWAAQDAPFHIQEFFSEIQPKLALWHRYLMNQKNDPRLIEELKSAAKSWSAQLIEFSDILAF